jgi:PTH1 family peptidyl-tRNA hydrolase
MNQSGKSIKACLDVYQLKAENLLVIHDDIDLPVGRVKVVRNGGSGGHKGVTSIIEHLGTREFSRVKVGIGRPRYGETVERYVLSPFYRDDKEIIEEVIEMSVRACELFVSEGVVAAMNHINWENMADKEVMY